MVTHPKHTPSECLFGAALVQGIVGYAGYSSFASDPRFGLTEWIITFGGAIFLALSLVSRMAPRTASLSALALFLLYLGYQASISYDRATSGLIFKTPILILLVWALISSMRMSKPPPTIQPQENDA